MSKIEDFEKLDIRVGRIIAADNFPAAKKPAYKLQIDLGKELGVKKSTAQLTVHYTTKTLIGKLVLCVVNFPPRQIGPAISEVLVLGVPDEQGQCILLTPDIDAPIGGKVF